jgi:hypothetical protein
MSTNSQHDQTDLERVSRVVDDLVADAEESDPEAVLMAALGKVRKRGDD